MPLDGLTSGIDHKLVLTDVNGVQNFALIESFTSKEDATVDKLIQMDGNVRHPKFHVGWSGSFVLQRNSDLTDSYFANQEALYYQGVDQQDLTILETIQENDGTVTQWQYQRVVLTLEDAGDFSGNAIVKQTVSFMAARKVALLTG